MTKVVIGPCCIKQHNIVLDNNFWNLSSFQISRLHEIMKDPDFEYFAMPSYQEGSAPRKSGNIIVPYYKKDGMLISENIGVFRVLDTLTA